MAVALSFSVAVTQAGMLVALVFTSTFIETLRSWPNAAALTVAFALVAIAARGVVVLTGLLTHWCMGPKWPWGVIQSWMTFCLGAVVLSAWLSLFFLIGEESASAQILNLSVGLVLGSGVLASYTLGPWWRYRHTPPAAIESEEMSAWLAEVSARHTLPPFRVCFEQADGISAQAHSTLLGDYVVLHRGLLDMPARLQQAVVAHEIGHLLCGDPVKQLYLIVFAVFLYVQFYPQIYRWWVREEWLIGVLVQANFIVVFYVGLPGR